MISPPTRINNTANNISYIPSILYFIYRPLPKMEEVFYFRILESDFEMFLADFEMKIK